VKVLTHQPRYIEPAVVPEFGVGSSSAAEAKQTVSIMQSAEEPTVVPKMPTVKPTLSKDDKAKEPPSEETMKMPEIMSPLTEAKTAEGTKNFFRDSQEEKNGQRVGRCDGDYESFEPRSFKENCQSAN
jgi:hypothetical protein